MIRRILFASRSGWTVAVVVAAGILSVLPLTVHGQPDGRSAEAAVDTAGVSETMTQKGTAYVSEIHDATVSVSETHDGTVTRRTDAVQLQARAIHNGQVGYTAFALWLRPPATPSGDVQVTTGDATWSIRARNVSVRDTATVLVVDRRQFARLAGTDSARIEVGAMTIEVPTALRRQIRAIEAVCTRDPMGCAAVK